MALEALTARANTGDGTDELAVIDTPGGKAGAVALVDSDGVLHDGTNPVPVSADDLSALLKEIAARLVDIGDSVAVLMPDVAGRLRVNAELVANIATITTVSTVTTVTTVSTVTTVGSVTSLANQVSIGGYAANQHMIALTQMAEGNLRRNIVIS